VGAPEGKRPHGRTTYRWKDTIKLDLKEIEWKDVHCIHLVQDKTSDGLL
jgi:hypothetical protein